MKEKILVFIPMYNCEKQIIRVMDQLKGEIEKYITEVLIVDNRSTDCGESAVMEKAGSMHVPYRIRLLRNRENYGLGGSHKVAFGYAVKNGFDYVIVLHGDDQGNIRDILPYLKNRKYKKYDCFLGARFMRGSKLQGYSKFRTFGNCVYNLLFSAGTRNRVYDLGSGLNMYRADILKDKFYQKYKDDLMFNYCMILGAAYYGHSIKFFPILWREDDQVSNVKMVRQAVTVLGLLAEYVCSSKKFARSEHRDRIVKSYDAEIIYTSQCE